MLSAAFKQSTAIVAVPYAARARSLSEEHTWFVGSGLRRAATSVIMCVPWAILRETFWSRNDSSAHSLPNTHRQLETAFVTECNKKESMACEPCVRGQGSAVRRPTCVAHCQALVTSSVGYALCLPNRRLGRWAAFVISLAIHYSLVKGIHISYGASDK